MVYFQSIFLVMYYTWADKLYDYGNWYAVVIQSWFRIKLAIKYLTAYSKPTNSWHGMYTYSNLYKSFQISKVTRIRGYMQKLMTLCAFQIRIQPFVLVKSTHTSIYIPSILLLEMVMSINNIFSIHRTSATD